MKKNILIYGVSTYKNRGVEAIINSTLSQIDQSKYNITIACYDLQYNKKFYGDLVEYINHYRKDHLTSEEKELETKYMNMPFDYHNFELLYQKDVVKAMEKADICISAGGDNYCYPHCSWLYALDEKSKELGKKTILWGSSLFEFIEDDELIDNIRNFDLLVIRESLTLNAVQKYIPSERILFMKDPAFSLKKKRVSLDSWYNNRKYIIINVSPLTIKDDDGYNAIKGFIDYIIKKTKYSICLLPHVKTPDNNDIDILKRIKEDYSDNNDIYLESNDYNCSELKYIISKSQFTVAARTHASIAAYSTCIPTLVIGYSVKSKGIAKDLFGSYNDYVIDSNSLTKERLIEKFKYLEDNRSKIIDTLKQQCIENQKEGSSIFEEALKRLNDLELKRICDHNDCIGCGLCSHICPVNAIDMIENVEGYIYPEIDLNKCIHCDKCRNSCPVLKKQKQNKYKKEFFAIKNKNRDVVFSSTSGGAFSIFAEHVLRKKGIVYGCQMQNNKAVHIRIDNMSDLHKVRGSKYNQSTLMNVYADLEKDLKSGKLILFSGTPCQIGMIKSLYQDNYKNLITVSVICHGVINDKILHNHIQALEKKHNGILTEWKFRSKLSQWDKPSVEYKINNDQKVVDFLEDDLMNMYLKNVFLRECCYNCKYKQNNNNSDIIIADYWGIEETNKDFYDKNGVSALIINSGRGKEFISTIDLQKYANITAGTFEDMLKYNTSLVRSVNRPIIRSRILRNLDDISMNILRLNTENWFFQKNYKKLLDENNLIRTENDHLKDRLNLLENSRRWQMVNKVADMINKIKKNKKVKK